MEKKTKLTISGSTKKSIENIEIAKNQSKNSVVIQKKQVKILVKAHLTKDLSHKDQKKVHLFYKNKQILRKIFHLFQMILKNVSLQNKEQQEE